MTPLKELENINYPSNNIATVDPDHFAGLDHLKVVNLNANPLKSLPNLCKADVDLLLAGVTDLICDCSVRYLKYLMPDSYYTPCSQPAGMVGRKISDLSTEDFKCDTGKPNVIF